MQHTAKKDLKGRHPIQAFAWAKIDLADDSRKVSIGNIIKGCLFREILPQEAVRILIGPSLPR